MERLAREAYNSAVAVNNGPGVVAAVIVHQEKERYYIRTFIHKLQGKNIACDDIRTVGYIVAYTR